MSTPRPAKGFLEGALLLVAQGFGSGRSRFAPGTVGSLLALVLALPMRQLPALSLALGAVLWTLVGTWASNVTSAILDEEDPQSVVVDEIAGVWIALAFVPGASGILWLVAFGLFRLFDIWKPGPIEKIQYVKPNGVGIMADDVLAGLAAGLVTFGLDLAFPALG